MKIGYAAKYYDKNGSEAVTIENDGHELHMVVRGVTFASFDLEIFEITAGEGQHLFTFNEYNELAKFFLEWEMPIQIMVSGKVEQGRLLVQHCMGFPPPHIEDMERGIMLTLTYNAVTAKTATQGNVENGLYSLQRQIPTDHYLCVCVMCAFSLYHPLGGGFFGRLGCFRDVKAEFMQVEDKSIDDVFQIWHKMTDYVQETHLCSDFRRKGAV